MKTKIKILEVISTFSNSGGIQSYVYNLCESLDKEIFKVDVLSHRWLENFHANDHTLENKFNDLGINTYSITDPNESIIKFRRDLINFFTKHNDYDIIHVHPLGTSALFLWYAKKFNIKMRVFQAMETKYSDKLSHRIRNVPLVFASRTIATKLAAISKDSGKAIFKNKPFEILPPSVNYNDFYFNNTFRNKWRSNLNIPANAFVVGAIGRMTKQKNLKFVLDVFEKLRKKIPDSILIICGDGPQEKMLKDHTKKLGLEKKVRYTGSVSCINELYSCLDCLALPSLYEGLPLVSIQSQVSGIPCFASNNITTDIDIGNCYFLPINNVDIWAEKLLCFYNKNEGRFSIKDFKYDKNIVSTLNNAFFKNMYLGIN